MNKAGISLVAIISVGLLAACAKGPSEATLRGNKCYETAIENRFTLLPSMVSTQDEVDIRVSEKRMREDLYDWILKYQQANDLTDPFGGITAASHGLSNAKERTMDDFRELQLVLTRPTIPPKAGEYVGKSIINALKMCYPHLNTQ